MKEGKFLKYYAIKCTAILMAAIYILTPVHNPVLNILHNVSHQLEESISELYASWNTQHHSHGHSHAHSHTHHVSTNRSVEAEVSEDHSHPVIEFLASAISDDENGEALATKLKYDDHIIYELEFPIVNNTSSYNLNTWFYLIRNYNIFPLLSIPPPKYNS